MSQPTPDATEPQKSDAEAQRDLVPTYVAAIHELVRAAGQHPPGGASLPLDWAIRELELAGMRIYANRQEFLEELDEIVREVRERIAQQAVLERGAAP